MIFIVTFSIKCKTQIFKTFYFFYVLIFLFPFSSTTLCITIKYQNFCFLYIIPFFFFPKIFSNYSSYPSELPYFLSIKPCHLYTLKTILYPLLKLYFRCFFSLIPYLDPQCIHKLKREGFSTQPCLTFLFIMKLLVYLSLVFTWFLSSHIYSSLFPLILCLFLSLPLFPIISSYQLYWRLFSDLWIRYISSLLLSLFLYLSTLNDLMHKCYSLLICPFWNQPGFQVSFFFFYFWL